MTPIEWIGAGALDFAMSLAAFVIWTHLDLEGWYDQRKIAKGRKLEEKELRRRFEQEKNDHPMVITSTRRFKLGADGYYPIDGEHAYPEDEDPITHPIPRDLPRPGDRP